MSKARNEKITHAFSDYKTTAANFCNCASDPSKKNCDSLNYIADWYRLHLDTVVGSFNLRKEWGIKGEAFYASVDSIGTAYMNCKSTYYQRTN